jgi:putative Mg2+ transporter-C (MgtC) family protein
VASIIGFGNSIGIDTSRVAAGVVAGIGFLGAGAIMRRSEGIIEGLTTAATIWAVAAVGLAAGAGMYLISGVATALVVGILFLPHRDE